MKSTKAVLLSIIFFLGLNINSAFSENDGKMVKSINESVSVSGKVIDRNTGEPLAGVKIEINGVNANTYSDFDGNFYFKNIQPGNYNISSKLISYKKDLVDININKNTKELRLVLESVND